MNSFDPIGHSGPAAAPLPKLQKACAEFESLFLHQLLKQMRATVNRSGFLDGGPAGDMYTAMLDSHLARVVAAGGGIGLAAMLQQQLEKTESTPEALSQGASYPGSAAIPRSNPNHRINGASNLISGPIKVSASGSR
jgi:flagellar protein FlgJ